MESKLQDLAPGEIVTLYELDNTVNGGRRLRYTPAVDAAAAPSRAVQFGGHTYLPLPVEMRGFKRAVDGPVARPELRISAVNAETTALLLGADNLRGARVTRFRTLAQFLDRRPTADATRRFGEEIWRVEKLTRRAKDEVVWQLASPLDFDAKKLPGRQVLRDLCPWQYRRWDAGANNNAGAWDYSEAQCPYTGLAYFNAKDQPVVHAREDQCSRRLSGCLRRYPRPSSSAPGDTPLPFGGFPGVGRLRV
ncbi:MAG: phage minor tail protein L [Gammaproteobacteria bacterium]|nr:phage minor tail protein L [Gammaproteobacteria bacterium]